MRKLKITFSAVFVAVSMVAAGAYAMFQFQPDPDATVVYLCGSAGVNCAPLCDWTGSAEYRPFLEQGNKALLVLCEGPGPMVFKDNFEME